MINISAETNLDVLIIHVGGIVDSKAAGTLSDALVGHIQEGWRRVVIDLASVRTVTRAGVGPLVVAAKLLRSAGGEMRICRATSQTEAFLANGSFRHLLRFDPTRNASVSILSAARRCDRPYEVIATLPLDTSAGSGEDASHCKDRDLVPMRQPGQAAADHAERAVRTDTALSSTRSATRLIDHWFLGDARAGHRLLASSEAAPAQPGR